MKLFKNYILIFLLTTFTQVALATTPMKPVDFDLLSSDDCGYLTAEVPDSGPNMRSLVLRFQDFGVITTNSTYVERKCELDVYVTVPRGMRFRPSAALADGEVSTSEKGSAYIALSYSWAGDSVNTEKWFERNILDTFLARAIRGGGWMYSACENRDSVHHVGGSFLISAYRDKRDANDSDIALFNAEQQNKLTSRWIWEWEHCNPWLNHDYKSRYTNPNGQWVNGSTSLLGDKGTYSTDGGASGELYNVQYSTDYSVAQGYWRFQNGSTGWFQFVLSDETGTEFSGIWGTGDRIGISTKGKWESR
ncbi:MAG: hypothetical protein P8Y45_17690 [Exilibacterium sp.]